MTKTFAALAAILTLAACAAAANPAPAQAHAAPAIDCSIRATTIRGGVRFEALARSQRTAFGQYDFVLTKSDRGGSSDIVQGGDFDLRGADQQTLGSAEISVERGARYRARLVLRDGDDVLCRDDIQS